MSRVFWCLCLVASSTYAQGVRSWEGTLEIPTYVHSARDTQPPLFSSSTLGGLYPFTTYVYPFTAESPKPRTYKAIFVENEYLKLAYIPEFGGRIFSLYDKLRGREVFYRNDVIKPAPYNPRNNWPQSGLELTGPYDMHMPTLYGEPFWANRVMKRADGAIALVLGETDPIYGMDVTLTATLHPGVAALEIGVRCYNARDARMPQMLWINTAIDATPKTRFLYQMSRTVGHTTADIADWPVYNGIDYSWDRNNRHMLGVFGIDAYDDYNGAYQFDRDYGIFRFADRRVVQGMKLWTFGYGEGAKSHERGYTDNAGPYVELQSGRYVWDGHYEWVEPHKTESWTEWWIPVAGLGGVSRMNREVAFQVEGTEVRVESTRDLRGVAVEMDGDRRTVDLQPGKVVRLRAARPISRVSVNGLDWRRDADRGRKEYTPFTKPLEKARKPVEQMTGSELVAAAEYKFKELDPAGARALLAKALAKDPENARAFALLGIDDFRAGRDEAAAENLERATERDPYLDEAYYYLALARQSDRPLYYIPPGSAFYGPREFQLGLRALGRRDWPGAAEHLRAAVDANAGDLLARHVLSMASRSAGDRGAAMYQIEAMERIEPTSRAAAAERWLLGGEPGELLRLLGGQTQEALDTTLPYCRAGRFDEAARILRLVADNNRDPFGTTPEFYYTVAYCERRAGDAAGADAALKKARDSAGNIDRFPYREESLAPLEEAVRIDPADSVARFALGCLLYYRGQAPEAIRQWEAAGEGFATQRALGLAYAEQGRPAAEAAARLERAVEANPSHVRTRDDLSRLYARAGLFDKQLAVLEKALARSPEDDDLTEAVFTADLLNGRYDDAERLVQTHRFAPRHRSYGLRDKYRLLRYATGSRALASGSPAAALRAFDSALNPPESLGADDFENQGSPLQLYLRGRALESLGRKAEAERSLMKAAEGAGQLSGDRDSWSPENFYVVLSLDRLGRRDEADGLAKRFESFASAEVDGRTNQRRATARYLLALVRERQGRSSERDALLRSALDTMPDFLPAKLAIRGDLATR